MLRLAVCLHLLDFLGEILSAVASLRGFCSQHPMFRMYQRFSGACVSTCSWTSPLRPRDARVDSPWRTSLSCKGKHPHYLYQGSQSDPVDSETPSPIGSGGAASAGHERQAGAGTRRSRLVFNQHTAEAILSFRRSRR